MANLKKLAHGEIKIIYRSGPDFILPFRFYADDIWSAEKVALKKAISDLIIEESPALENAMKVIVNSISIEI